MRKLPILVCTVVLLGWLASSSVFATPVVSLNSQAEWAAAIGPMISPLTAADWGGLGTAFQNNIGAGTFVESNLWASPGGTYTETLENIELPAGMGMEWATPNEGSEYIAGWKYDYGLDPNLLGQTILLDATPPVFSPATGFVINTLGIGLVDVNGATRSWTYNVGAPIANTVLQRNIMNFVEINVAAAGAGAAGDATHGLGPPPGPFPFDLAMYADNGLDPTKVVWIVGIENGAVPVGGTIAAPPPGGGGGRNAWNWWGTLNVTPEPATLALLVLGGLALVCRRRK